MEALCSISRTFLKKGSIPVFLLSIPAILQTSLMSTDILNLKVALGWRLYIAEEQNRRDQGGSHFLSNL